MDLNMDDYIDPYEEAEAVAAGLGGPAAVDYDDPDSEAASSGRATTACATPTPSAPWKKKQNYKLKDLLQHVDGIGISIKRQRSRLCMVCSHGPVLHAGTRTESKGGMKFSPLRSSI